jgi:hypothetical protein
VCRSGVHERNEGRSAQAHLELNRVTGGHPRDHMQGENWGRCVRLIGSRGLVGCLEPANVENPPADAVVPTCIFLVAIEAQAEAAAFLLFRPGQTLHLLPFPGD